MLVEYYNNPELAYTTRKRYKNFSFEPFSHEEQKSILLGDGAKTSIKTKKSNICNYVKIDDTRWYVTHYEYMNGGQVTLFLQRDVIGEFGLGDCYGKIERGYTDSILKNRKELDLNQILKKRQKLIPNNNTYLNYSVNTHKNEAWGILYLVKPTEINPETGEPYPEKVNINIPQFAPIVADYQPLDNNSEFYVSESPNSYLKFELGIRYNKNNESRLRIYTVTINFNLRLNGYSYSINDSGDWSNNSAATIVCYLGINPKETDLYDNAIGIVELIASGVIDDYVPSFVLPQNITLSENIPYKYDGVNIKNDNGEYLHYTMENITKKNTGDTEIDKMALDISNLIEDKTLITGNYVDRVLYSSSEVPFDYKSLNIVNVVRFTYRVLSKFEVGDFIIDVGQQLIDEPFNILAFPLFDCIISGNGKDYNIDKETAFMVFNTVIQYLSGENPYIVDAQIYPYCPMLTGVSSEVNGYPFFSINSTTYEHYCDIQLLPNSDVKKEYMEREYTILSPDQSGRFTFNFYDYSTIIDNNNGTNFAKLRIIIKTALKPFAIISSAVIQPEVDITDSIVGITYGSDLRGSQPSSNGFECSLSSNAFETYKRQNSNYQEFFKLDQKELKKQHEVELTNDIVSTVINTASATAMGAIAGAEMADAGLWGKITGSRSIGAGIGAGVAGGAVGAAMIAQTVKNDELRAYERSLQSQRFDLTIGTIKNLPNAINRISSFNEIILKDFWYVVETYECTEYEKQIVNNFIEKYGYSIGVFDFVVNYYKKGWFLRSTLISSSYSVNLHSIAESELMGGIYYYE